MALSVLNVSTWLRSHGMLWSRVYDGNVDVAVLEKCNTFRLAMPPTAESVLLLIRLSLNINGAGHS